MITPFLLSPQQQLVGHYCHASGPPAATGHRTYMRVHVFQRIIIDTCSWHLHAGMHAPIIAHLRTQSESIHAGFEVADSVPQLLSMARVLLHRIQSSCWQSTAGTQCQHVGPLARATHRDATNHSDIPVGGQSKSTTRYPSGAPLQIVCVKLQRTLELQATLTAISSFTHTCDARSRTT